MFLKIFECRLILFESVPTNVKYTESISQLVIQLLLHVDLSFKKTSIYFTSIEGTIFL